MVISNESALKLLKTFPFELCSIALVLRLDLQVSHQKRGRHRKSKLGSDILSLLKRTKQIASLKDHL